MRRVSRHRTLEASLIAVGVVIAFASCSSSETTNGGAAGTSGASAGTPSGGGSHSGAGHGGNAAAGGTRAEAGASGTLGASGALASGGAAGATGGSAGLGGSAADDGGADASGGEAGASGPVTHDCSDGKESTVDFYKPAYGCGHIVDSNPNDGESWINFDAGFSVDPRTGTAWYYASAAGNVTQAKAAIACAALGIGSLDFRMPTIDDARAIGYRCPATAPGGTCPIHDPACLTKACGYGVANECASCLGGTGNHYVNPDASPFNGLGYHTSSLCADCAGTVQDWEYGIFNGNFFLQDVNQPWSVVCVISNLPDALP